MGLNCDVYHFFGLYIAISERNIEVLGIRKAFLKWLFHLLHHSVLNCSRHIDIYQTK